MPNTTAELQPFPRRDFIPHPRDMTDAVRLRYIIEKHARLKKNYGQSYRNVLEMIETVESGSEMGLSTLTPEQKTTLLGQLNESRNNTARVYIQAIQICENMANELAPGTFPQQDTPTTSWDIGELIEKILEWLAELFEEVGDVLGHFGWEEGEEAADWAAEKMREAQRILHEFRDDDDD